MNNTTKILIADDDPSIIKLLMTIINREHFIGITVTNGRDAIRELKANIFNLVICDQVMPHATGIEVAQWMRGSENNSNTPFVLLTAEENSTLIGEKIREKLIDSYIPKPFSYSQFTSHMNMMLKMQRLPNMIGSQETAPVESS